MTILAAVFLTISLRRKVLVKPQGMEKMDDYWIRFCCYQPFLGACCLIGASGLLL